MAFRHGGNRFSMNKNDCANILCNHFFLNFDFIKANAFNGFWLLYLNAKEGLRIKRKLKIITREFGKSVWPSGTER